MILNAVNAFENIEGESGDDVLNGRTIDSP